VVVRIQCFDFGLRWRRHDEALPEDEAEEAISFWFNGTEA
jgi:hypothetical protein